MNREEMLEKLSQQKFRARLARDVMQISPDWYILALKKAWKPSAASTLVGVIFAGVRVRRVVRSFFASQLPRGLDSGCHS